MTAVDTATKTSGEALPDRELLDRGACRSTPILPADRLEPVESWGMNRSVMSYVYRPSTVDQVRDVFRSAERFGVRVGIRGAGRSYGDASLLAEQICLDLTRMNRILSWDPETGVLAAEPGATIRQIWQHAIGDGWWPIVVPGTMFVSLGGAAAMNIHGKNNWKVGPIGDSILEFDLLTPSGDVLTCSRARNAELFHSAIGGFGLLGCFTRIVLRMKRVHSGLLDVNAFATAGLGETIEQFEARMDHADYLVGWVDCFARGGALGRTLVHQANYVAAEDDPAPAQSLRVENQELPDALLGVVPKSLMWRLMRPFASSAGMRLLNWAKYRAGSTVGNDKTVRQSHAAFAFLLDYVPNWKYVYKPGGLIQYQSFVPHENALRCFEAQIRRCQAEGIVPYLGVFKRHRRDDFLMSHSVDGYSLALDFPVTDRNRKRLWTLTGELNRLVIESGGRFYFAKDSTLDPASAEMFLGRSAIERFVAVKRECDPAGVLQTDLSRRLFGEQL